MWSRLPDELLLQIACYVSTNEDDSIDDYDRRFFVRHPYLAPPKSSPIDKKWGDGKGDLLALSLVDRRTRAVVLELLVSDISVQFRNVHSLVILYVHYPDLAAKTKALEIKSSGLMLGYKKFSWSDDAHRFSPDEAFVQACKPVVWEDRTTDLLDKSTWMHELRAGNMNALFAILFSVLTNMENLHLQRTSLQHVPFIKCLFEPPGVRDWHQPLPWRCEYISKVFAPHIASIHDLELPKNWHSYGAKPISFPHHMPVRSLFHFRSLHRLVVPESALFETFKNVGFDKVATSRDACAILPQTLQSLTIFNIDFRNAFKKQDHRVLDFLRKLFLQTWNSWQQQQEQSADADQLRQMQQQQQRPATRLFPTLRYIYVEYVRTDAFFDHVLTLQEWARIELIQQELQQMGKVLGGEVEFSFPWVGDPFY